MKRILLLLLCLPLAAIAQETGDVGETTKDLPSFSLNFRPYYNPTFFKAHESEIVSNDYEFVHSKGIDMRLNYHFLEVFAGGIGIGVHDFNLRMNNNGFWQRLNDDDEVDDIDYFGQQVYYLTVPIEIGVAPRIGTGGWFEPRLTIGVTPHFNVNQQITMEFSDSTSWSATHQQNVQSDFEGGAREVYTSVDVLAEFKFWVGSTKNAGIGMAFGFSDNLSGPQSYVLRNGAGFSIGLTVSGRF